MNMQTIAEFKKTFSGILIQPEDSEYESARRVYNGMIDKKPGLIAKCADVYDVVRSVNFARDRQMLLAVRGGGHNGAGLGICDGGLVIDLSGMKNIQVDPELKTVRADGGCLLSELDAATHAFGLAVPAGIFSSTGIGGLTLGGGLGHLTRTYGLTIDNLLSATVVLANGTIVTASKDEHPDLFWAIRGGGGNFGVVVSFLFRAQTVSQVFGGPMIWDMKDAKAITRWFRKFTAEAPDDISCFLAYMIVPPAAPFPENLQMKKVCGLVWCCPTDEARAALAFQAARVVAAPMLDWTGPISFPALQSMFDAVLPTGLQQYWKGDYINELPDEAIDIHLLHAEKFPSWQSTTHIYPINGVASRIGKKETAWNYRSAKWATVILGVSENSSGKNSIVDWAGSYAKDLTSFGAGGAYVNFMMDEGQERVAASYGDNYQRLVEIKNMYDPTNLFRVNQNIRPSKK
jgi:hypothetical protein